MTKLISFNKIPVYLAFSGVAGVAGGPSRLTSQFEGTNPDFFTPVPNNLNGSSLGHD